MSYHTYMKKKLYEVRGDTLYNPYGQKLWLVGSDAWYKWLDTAVSFRFINNGGGRANAVRSIRHRNENTHIYWRLRKQIDNRIKVVSLGKSEAVDLAALNAALETVLQTEMF